MSRKGVLVALVALAAGIASAWLMLSNDIHDATGTDVALVLTVGWSFVVTGVVAWDLRPDNPIGPVMIASGFLRFGAALGWSEDALLFSIGSSLTPAYLIGLGYVLLAFPSGHLSSRFERVVFGAVVVAGGPLHVAWLTFGTRVLVVEHQHSICANCPEYVFQIADVEPVATAFRVTHEALAVAGGLLALVILVNRWRHATAPLRFAIAPILWAGSAAWVVVLFWISTALIGDPLGRAPEMAVNMMLALVAVAFLVGVARTRLARSAVADLVVGLGDSPAPGELQSALGQALHDPTLSVVYWLPEEERFIDAEGKSVDLTIQNGRAVTMIEKDGRRIAALVHDPATLEDEQLVRSVGAAAALQLENERLQAELRAQLDEVEASRARIVEAAQEERRRIERDLHDGTQQRLVSIAMTLGLADSKLSSDPTAAGQLVKDAKGNLSGALQELRDLSQGIHPGILTERGLPAALAELVQRIHMPIVLDLSLPGRLPDRVEEAVYYIVSEALTNIVKYAHASKGHVQVERWNGVARIVVSDDGTGGAEAGRGSGLPGLRDRVEALGGELIIQSPRGAGTVLEVKIPCA